jgi:cytochrome c peroxidase
MFAITGSIIGSVFIPFAHADAPKVDTPLVRLLKQAGFTGTVQSSVETRLGRPINPALADLGRLVFFDNIMGLHNDNSCAGCHSPAVGLGDSQSMAIGTDNNGIVGPGRIGPRNQRRAPMVINTSLYPSIMLNLRCDFS